MDFKKYTSFLYKLFGSVTVTIAAIYCCLAIYTYQSPKPSFLEKKLNHLEAFAIHFERSKFVWQGLKPGIRFYGLTVQDKKSNLPKLLIEKADLYWSIPQLVLFWQNNAIIDTGILEGAKFGLHTDDHIQYHITGIEALSFSLQKSMSPLPFKKMLIKRSDILLSNRHDKLLAVTDTNVSIRSDHNKLSGNATVLGESPAFVRFNHVLNNGPRTDVHQWFFALYSEQTEDLVAWFPEKFDLKWRGKAHFQAWVSQTPKEADFIVDFKLQDADINQSEATFKVDNMTGYMSGHAVEDNWSLSAHDIKWSNLLINRQEIPFLGDLTFSVMKQQAAGNDKQFEVVGANITMAIVEHLVSGSRLKEQFSQMSVAQKGHIENIRVAFRQSDKKVELSELDVNLVGIQFKATEALALDNIDAQIKYANHNGTFSISSEASELAYARWFNQPLFYQNIALMGAYQIKNNQLTITKGQGRIDTGSIQAVADFSLFVPNKGQPTVKMNAVFNAFEVEQIVDYLPRRNMHPKLQNWLDEAFQYGIAQNVRLSLNKNLTDIHSAHSKNDFELVADLQQLNLKFHRDWPMLENANIQLKLKNRTLKAMLDQGTLLEMPVREVIASIEDMTAKPAILKTQIKSNSEIVKALEIIEQSPLATKVAQSLEPYQLQGNSDLTLDLIIPLSTKHKKDLKVDGNIQARHGQAYLYKQDIMVTDIFGQIDFTKNTVTANELKGKIWGLDSTFQLRSAIRDSKRTMIVANGKVDTQKVLAHFLKQPIQIVSGISDYQVKVNIDTREDNWQGDFQLDSNLSAVTVDLPAPFTKTAETTKHFILKGTSGSHQNAEYIFEMPEYSMALSFAPEQKAKRLLGGHLHVGSARQAALRSDGVFKVDGRLSEVNLLEYFDSISQNVLKFDAFSQSTNQNSTVKQNTVMPVLDLLVDKLLCKSFTVSKARLEGVYDQELDNLLFSVVSPEVDGYLAIPRNDLERVVVVDLDHVIVPDNVSVSELEKRQFEMRKWRFPIEVRIDNLVKNNHQLRNVLIKFDPIQYGYSIKHLSFGLANTDITAKGYWHEMDNQGQVDISGLVKTENISEPLEVLGIKNSLKNAEGEIAFNLSWKGLPIDIDKKSLSGEVNFDLKKGVIEGVNPGFGRVLSLLNLDNLQRRLSLDFSDVTKRGMAFDSLSGKVQLIDGSIYSDKVVLEAPSALVEAQFRTRFDSQHLSGRIDVMPNLTGSLPIAAAIASGNPAVGAAVWVMDKLLGRQIQEINKNQYHLTGSWSDPELKPIQSQVTKRGP